MRSRGDGDRLRDEREGKSLSVPELVDEGTSRVGSGDLLGLALRLRLVLGGIKLGLSRGYVSRIEREPDGRCKRMQDPLVQ